MHSRGKETEIPQKTITVTEVTRKYEKSDQRNSSVNDVETNRDPDNKW